VPVGAADTADEATETEARPGMKRTLARRPWVWVACCAALLAGCSPTYYKEDADKSVYRILHSAEARTVGAPPAFTLETTGSSALDALRKERGEFGPAGADEKVDASLDPAKVEGGIPVVKGAIRLTLRDALRLAAEYSRDYRTQKESLYLSALALTLERFQWEPQLEAKVGITHSREKNQIVDTEVFLEDGTVETVEVERQGVDTWSGDSAISVSKLLALGGTVTVKLATDVLKVANGGRPQAAASVLTGEFLQPLWRGAGRLVAREDLTQAERDTIYAVRTFARFRKSFCVGITSSYYRVLQSRDAVVNAWRNWDSIRLTRERTEAEAAAGRRAEFEVDQARQQVLTAQSSWVTALQRYQEAVDAFKIDLALPADARIELDPAEIERLRDAGLGAAGITFDDAIDAALNRRLDLLNAVDGVADAERKVEIAQNGLGTDVDLRLLANVPSTDRHNRPLKLPFHRGTYSAGLDVDLPLQRTVERNAYRQALINLDRAARGADEERDQVSLSVRQDWRNLREAAESYEIKLASVELARRRIESTSLLLQRPDSNVKVRDVLEANDALLEAENALTSALINHTLARLDLWRDTELLQVDAQGVWQDIANAQD